MTASGDELQCCAVYDWPRFPYRGLMIDVSRNFRDRQFIEKQIDAMALLKMDKLHLHLMGCMARLLKSKEFIKALPDCKSNADVIKLVMEQERTDFLSTDSASK